MPIKNTLRVGLIILNTLWALGMMTMPVSAGASCSFTLSDIDFGDIHLIASTSFTTTGTLTASCSGGEDGQAITICANLGAGSGGAGSGGIRYLANGGDLMQYNLYKESAHSNIWGSLIWGYSPTPLNWQPVANGSGNVNASVTIYAKISTGQTTRPAGAYSSSFSGTSHVRIDYSKGSDDCDQIDGGDGDGTETVPFTITANSIDTCSVSATNIDFGSVGGLSSNVDSTSTVDVTCTNEVPYDVGLDNGLTGSSPTARKMTTGGNEVTYGLFRDPGRTQPWGDTIGVNTASGTGNGSAQALTVYGRVGVQTTPPAATYTDTIVVTVTY